MKQHKHWMLIAWLALILAACAQPTPAPTPTPQPPTSTPVPTRPAPTLPPQDDSWQKVQEAGVLRVGTSADYPPFEYYNDKFELDGFDELDLEQMEHQPDEKPKLPLRDAAAKAVPDDPSRAATDLEGVYDIPVQVSAVLGKATMQVNQLLKLGRGAVVELDRKVGEAIDIYVNNRLVARGEVVSERHGRTGKAGLGLGRGLGRGLSCPSPAGTWQTCRPEAGGTAGETPALRSP